MNTPEQSRGLEAKEVITDSPQQRQERLGKGPESTLEQPTADKEVIAKISELLTDPDIRLSTDDQLAIASLSNRITSRLAYDKKAFEAIRSERGDTGSIKDTLDSLRSEHNGGTLGFGAINVLISREIGDDEGYVVLDKDGSGREVVSSSDKGIPSYEADLARGDLLQNMSEDAKQALFTKMGVLKPGETIDSRFESELQGQLRGKNGDTIRLKTNNENTLLQVTKGPGNGGKPTTTISFIFNPENVL
jgi:hypothetical protein